MFKGILQQSLQQWGDKKQSEFIFTLKLFVFACIMGALVTALINYSYRLYKDEREKKNK